MSNNLPPEWVLREAAKWSELDNDSPRQRAILFETNPSFRALCAMILKHEQPPVDRKLLCAQAAITGILIELDALRFPKKECIWDCCVRAIELWEDGFGK